MRNVSKLKIGSDVYNIKDSTVDMPSIYIEDSGSNSYGSYIQYSDGQMVCYGNITMTGQANVEWNGLYYIDMGYKLYPIAFTDVPEVVLSTSGDRSGWILSYYNYSDSELFRRTNTPRCEIYRPVTDTGGHMYKLSYIAYGRWK